MNDKQLYSLVLSKKWHFYVTRKFNWFVENTQILANKSSTLRKYIGFDVSQDNYLVLNGDEYYTDKETIKYNSTFESLIGKDATFLDKFTKTTHKIAKEINRYIKNLDTLKIEYVSDRKLAEIILNFQEIYTLSFIPSFSRPDDYLQEKTKELIKTTLRVTEQRADDIFSKIATYPMLGELAYTDEPLELLMIAKLVKEKGYKLEYLPDEINNKLDKHIAKYSWMKGSILIEDVSFSRKEYLERLNNLISKDVNNDILRIKSIRNNDQIKYKELYKKYHFTYKLKRYAEAVRNFIFLRTYTTEASDKLFFFARAKLLREAAKMLGLSSEEIVMLSSDEISDLLLKNKNTSELKKLIEKRKEGYAVVWINGESQTLFGDKALRLQNTVADKYKGEVPKTTFRPKFIKGTPASLGKAKGVVKVLLNYYEVNKVNRGDILVASMTTPDYIMAMEKSAAFITDEGGITCHAAIVAREFGVPCIVGTGNATTLLKDGDVVEVDAEKGLVKILE